MKMISALIASCLKKVVASAYFPVPAVLAGHCLPEEADDGQGRFVHGWERTIGKGNLKWPRPQQF
jgi:hypothetical protein